MKTQTISNDQKWVNRIVFVATVLMGSGAVWYFVHAFKIVLPYTFK